MDDKLLDRLLESGILSSVLADELTTTLERIGMTLEEATEQALWNWYLDSTGAHRMEEKSSGKEAETAKAADCL